MTNRIYSTIPPPPKPPLSRVINEGAINNSGFCPKCHSTAQRKPWIVGKRYCINNECYHYYTPILKNRWDNKIKDLTENYVSKPIKFEI